MTAILGEVPDNHTCQHTEAKCDETLMVQSLKSKGLNTFTSPARLYSDALKEVPQNSKAYVAGKENNALKVLRATRRVNVPRDPPVLPELNIEGINNY